MLVTNPSELKEALKPALDGRGTEIVVPSRTNIILDEPIQCPSRVRIVGGGMGSSQIIWEADPSMGPLLDMTGAVGCTFEHISLCTSKLTEASSIVGMRRFRDGASSGCHKFNDVLITGYCLNPAIMSFGSEENSYRDCRILNGEPGGDAFLTAREMPVELWDTKGTGGSNCVTMMDGCTVGVYGCSGTENNMVIGGGTEHFTVYGGCFSNKQKGTYGGKAGIAFTYGPRACRNIVLNGVRMETWDARHGIMVGAGSVVLGLTIVDTLIAGSAACVAVAGVLRGSMLDRNQWLSKGNGVRVMEGGDVRQCELYLPSKELTDQCEQALIHVSEGTMFRGNRITLPLARTLPVSQGLDELMVNGNSVKMVNW